jgi:hypothetical protein
MASTNRRNGLIALALLASAGACWSIDPAATLPAASAPVAKTPPKAAINAAAKTTKPAWASLNPAQQQALAPLAGEWDQLELLRKQKWLEIANRFSSMKPEEQQRVQQRMRDWVKLTPEQRRVVRENYARSTRIDPGQKSAQWEQYQQLPEEQRKKLAADAPARKRVANLPSAAQSRTPLLPPIKSRAPAPAATIVTPAAATGQAAVVPPTPTPAQGSASTPDAASISPPTVNSAPANAK